MLPGFGRVLSPCVYTRDLMMLKDLRARIYGVIYIFHSFQFEVRQVRGPAPGLALETDPFSKAQAAAESECGGASPGVLFVAKSSCGWT